MTDVAAPQAQAEDADQPTYAVADLVEQAKPTIYAWSLIALCVFIVIAEGADLTALAIVVPQVAEHYGFSSKVMGLLLSISIVGSIGASYLLSPVVDRVGRRTGVIAGMTLATIGTAASAVAPDFMTFLLSRLTSGIGIGLTSAGIFPMPSEILARRYRTAATVVVSCGFPVGSAVSSMLFALVADEFGFRGAFGVGATLSLIALVLCVFILPESPYLSKNDAAKRRLLAQIGAPLPPPGAVLAARRAGKAANPVTTLFTDGRAIVTITLWMVSFLSLGITYLIIMWTPGLLARSGQATQEALSFYTNFLFAGVVLALIAAWLTTRTSPTLVVSAIFAAMIPAALAAFTAEGPGTGFFLAFFVLASLSSPAQFCVVGLLAEYYPSSARATGISYGMSAGRFGGILAPIVGGWLISLDLTINQIIGLCAVPATIASLAMITLFRSGKVMLAR